MFASVQKFPADVSYPSNSTSPLRNRSNREKEMPSSKTRLLFAAAIVALAITGCAKHEVPEAYAYDPDYLDIKIGYQQWAPAQTPALPNIVVCEGQIRYAPSLEPQPVCEKTTKAAQQANHEPARFVQLTDWLAERGYNPADFIHFDDEQNLWVSVLRSAPKVLSGAEYEDYFGHKPGYEFSGTGMVTTGAIRQVR